MATDPGKEQLLRYRLYIDESGDHAFRLVDDPAHRYLALMGVAVEQAQDYVAFVDELEGFKRRIFGLRPDKPVILHRSDIVNRKGAFGVLRNETLRQRFDDGLVEIVRQAKFRIMCIVIDKKQQPEKYASLASPFSLHPYHFCLAAMLYRYCKWLLGTQAVSDVMAESRGGEEDRQLASAYRTVYESGTMALKHESYQRALTSKDLKLRLKRAGVPGLQLADILAHPIKQACLAAHGLLEDQTQTFGQRLFAAAQPKLLGSEDGRAEGQGWCCF